jgi:hypothetical protein
MVQQFMAILSLYNKRGEIMPAAILDELLSF